MRNFARLCLAGVAVACSALLLSGCVQPDHVVTPAATTSSKPLFASDEEALAAATKAYAAYLKMSDQITSESGNDPSRIETVAIGAAARDARVGFEKFDSLDYHSAGSSEFDTASVQQVEDIGGGRVVVHSYVCLDVSGVRILDEKGTDVTPGDREDRLPLRVTVESASGASSLKVSGSDSWSGTNFC